MQHFILESQEEKFPAKNSSSAFDCFDWLYSWMLDQSCWLIDGAKIQIFLGGVNTKFTLFDLIQLYSKLDKFVLGQKKWKVVPQPYFKSRN